VKHLTAARGAALQALYLCDVGRVEPRVALETVFAEHLADAEPDVRAFAAMLVEGVVADRAGLDALIGAHSQHWRIERMAVIDLLVLRLGAWELRYQPDTPAAVVLNEAIELARTFGSDESPRFVNGVLDAIRKKLRTSKLEVQTEDAATEDRGPGTED
jgi:N utilization substance protein B